MAEAVVLTVAHGRLAGAELMTVQELIGLTTISQVSFHHPVGCIAGHKKIALFCVVIIFFFLIQKIVIDTLVQT